GGGRVLREDTIALRALVPSFMPLYQAELQGKLDSAISRKTATQDAAVVTLVQTTKLPAKSYQPNNISPGECRSTADQIGCPFKLDPIGGYARMEVYQNKNRLTNATIDSKDFGQTQVLVINGLLAGAEYDVALTVLDLVSKQATQLIAQGFDPQNQQTYRPA